MHDASSLMCIIREGILRINKIWRLFSSTLLLGLIGLLFGLEFFFLYWSLVYTSVSRSLILLYTHPFWVALGAHFFLRGDKLTLSKLLGLILAFGGVIAVFQDRPGQLPII